MVIFNSYVKLPEGIIQRTYIYDIYFLAHTFTSYNISSMRKAWGAFHLATGGKYKGLVTRTKSDVRKPGPSKLGDHDQLMVRGNIPKSVPKLCWLGWFVGIVRVRKLLVYSTLFNNCLKPKLCNLGVIWTDYWICCLISCICSFPIFVMLGTMIPLELLLWNFAWHWKIAGADRVWHVREQTTTSVIF